MWLCDFGFIHRIGYAPRLPPLTPKLNFYPGTKSSPDPFPSEFSFSFSFLIHCLYFETPLFPDCHYNLFPLYVPGIPFTSPSLQRAKDTFSQRPTIFSSSDIPTFPCTPLPSPTLQYSPLSFVRSRASSLPGSLVLPL